MDQQRFETIKNRIISSEREKNGIGTLQEKTVHAILKDYYAPQEGGAFPEGRERAEVVGECIRRDEKCSGRP